MAKHLDSFFGLDYRSCNSLEEACKKYGFDMELAKRTLNWTTAAGIVKTSPLNEQTVRIYENGNEQALGCVGLIYTLVPYREAFAPAQQLVEGGARIVSGGCPNHGERAYLVLEASGEIILAPNDAIVNRFTFISSHDGSSKIEVRMTPYRRKNGTTLTHDASRPLAFKHTSLVGNRITKAATIIDRVNKSWKEFEGAVQKMMAVDLSDFEAKSMIDSVLGGDLNTDSQRLVNIKMEIYTLWKETGIGTRVGRCKGTVFGMVEAFAEWADRHRTVRKSNKRNVEAASLDAKLVSDSAKKKQKAFAVGLYLAKKAANSPLASLNQL